MDLSGSHSCSLLHYATNYITCTHTLLAHRKRSLTFGWTDFKLFSLGEKWKTVALIQCTALMVCLFDIYLVYSIFLNGKSEGWWVQIAKSFLTVITSVSVVRMTPWLGSCYWSWHHDVSSLGTWLRYWNGTWTASLKPNTRTTSSEYSR